MAASISGLRCSGAHLRIQRLARLARIGLLRTSPKSARRRENSCTSRWWTLSAIDRSNAATTARVLARIFDLQAPIDKTIGREILWNRARQLVPKRRATRFNSALVDLGALICLPRKPRCWICPVSNFCRAPNPEILPLKKARPRTKQLTENHAFVIGQNKILLERSGSRWRGMWILPPLEKRLAKRRPLYMSIFPFTHHQVALKVYERSPRKIDNTSQRWIKIALIDSIPVPSPHRRAIRHLLTAARARQSHGQSS
jgi:A/G-specific adenine glycosylase